MWLVCHDSKKMNVFQVNFHHRACKLYITFANALYFLRYVYVAFKLYIKAGCCYRWIRNKITWCEFGKKWLLFSQAHSLFQLVPKLILHVYIQFKTTKTRYDLFSIFFVDFVNGSRLKLYLYNFLKRRKTQL